MHELVFVLPTCKNSIEKQIFQPAFQDTQAGFDFDSEL